MKHLKVFYVKMICQNKSKVYHLKVDLTFTDTFLAVNFLISTSTPVELDSVLESIILLSEGSTALHIDGIDCRIVHSSLHFGTTSGIGSLYFSSFKCMPR